MTNTNKQRIHLSIDFGDAILPIIECEDGHQRVPLKPIVEQIGAKWETQRQKVQPEKYLGRRLGSQITTLKGGEISQKQGNPTYLCIRIDRVTAFLNTINPENVRAMGNHNTADWLEAKHQEWDDALHQYETAGFAVNKSRYSNREAKDKGYQRLVSVIKAKSKTEDVGDRRLIASILKDMAEAQGLSYQTDLLDDQQQSA
ncbi:MAG: phage antirepressor N-terminal domain-containing protein [Methylobacter sp.]